MAVGGESATSCLPLWGEFRLQIRRAVERAGGTYVNASRWIPNEADFQDHVHLARSGAAKFSRMLAEQILGRGDTPAPLKE